MHYIYKACLGTITKTKRYYSKVPLKVIKAFKNKIVSIIKQHLEAFSQDLCLIIWAIISEHWRSLLWSRRSCDTSGMWHISLFRELRILANSLTSTVITNSIFSELYGGVPSEPGQAWEGVGGMNGVTHTENESHTLKIRSHTLRVFKFKTLFTSDDIRRLDCSLL